MLQALLGIRQMLDLAGNVEWFVAHNVQAVFLALHAFIFRTTDPSVPGAPFTNAQPIRRFTPLLQLLANSALTAVITWASFRMMWGRTTARSQFVLRVLLPRLLLSALLINFTLPLVQMALDGSNALCDSVMLATRQEVLMDVHEFS